jgi:hypothetical protein
MLLTSSVSEKYNNIGGGPFCTALNNLSMSEEYSSFQSDLNNLLSPYRAYVVDAFEAELVSEQKDTSLQAKRLIGVYINDNSQRAIIEKVITECFADVHVLFANPWQPTAGMLLFNQQNKNMAFSVSREVWESTGKSLQKWISNLQPLTCEKALGPRQLSCDIRSVMIMPVKNVLSCVLFVMSKHFRPKGSGPFPVFPELPTLIMEGIFLPC